MKILNQIEKDILSIFEIVCVISKEDGLFFEKSELLLEQLTIAKQLISNITLDNIHDELWKHSTYPDRESQIIKLVNNKFDKLITWKPHTESVLEMSNKLNEDLRNFYSRQRCIEREYDPFEISVINSLYKEIGQRAYKLDNILGQIMVELYETIEAEIKERGVISEQFNFNLNPEKSGHFAYLLAEMCKQNFFTSTKIDDTVLEIDVIFAFGELFKCDLVEPHFNFIDQHDILTSQNADLIAFESYIPITETTEHIVKGKAIRLLLYALENNNPPIITIGYRQAKVVHSAMTDFFARNIGKYQSVFDYKVDVKLDEKDLEKISIRLHHILSTI